MFRTHSFINSLAKSIPPLLIPVLLLQSIGCYSATTLEKSQDATTADVMIVMNDGRHYHFAEGNYSVDAEGNVTGSGVLCGGDAEDFHKTTMDETTFKGILKSSEIHQVWQEKLDGLKTGLYVTTGVLAVGGIVAGIMVLHRVAEEWNNPFGGSWKR